MQAQTYSSQVGTVAYSGTTTYSYDNAGQLIDDGTTAYSYDFNGNRTMAGYQTGEANRLTNDGVFTYSYDNEGNLSEKSQGASQETWYYGYDHANRLTSIRKTSDGTTNLLLLTYTYDVAGKRVQEQQWLSGVGTTETRFAYDGENVWADLSSGNSVEVRRMFGDEPDQVLTRTVASGPNAGLAYYQTDAQGSVRDVVNASSQVMAYLEYDGYGVRTDPQSSVSDRYGYTAREWHAGAGIQYNRARTLVVGAGAWMQEDPIALAAGDANLRRYVGNDPVNRSDPSGLYELVLGGLIFSNGLVGTVASGVVAEFSSIGQAFRNPAWWPTLIWVGKTLFAVGGGVAVGAGAYYASQSMGLQVLRDVLGIVMVFISSEALWNQIERAIQEEWAARGDWTAEAMTLKTLEGPKEMAKPDNALGPNAKRYQASVENEVTGERIKVSVNYDPDTGKFGTIKPSSIQD